MIHKRISYRRKQRIRAIKHKEHIVNSVYSEPYVVKSRGILSKGKVHCSCPLCAAKTKRNMGIRDRSIRSWAISDQRKMNKMTSQLYDYDRDYDYGYDYMESSDINEKALV